MLDIRPKYRRVSNLTEIMDFLSFDVARQHRKPRDDPAF